MFRSSPASKTHSLPPEQSLIYLWQEKTSLLRGRNLEQDQVRLDHWRMGTFSTPSPDCLASGTRAEREPVDQDTGLTILLTSSGLTAPHSRIPGGQQRTVSLVLDLSPCFNEAVSIKTYISLSHFALQFCKDGVNTRRQAV